MPTLKCESFLGQCIELISKQNVLEPYCAFLSPESHEAFRLASERQEKHRRALQEFTKDYMISLSRPRDLWCKVSTSISVLRASGGRPINIFTTWI